MAVLVILTVLLGLTSTVSTQTSHPFSICSVVFRGSSCYPLSSCPAGTTKQPNKFLFWNTCFGGTQVCCMGEPDEPDECQNADICGQVAPGGRLSFASNEVPRQSPWQVSIRRIRDDGAGFTIENSFHSTAGVLINRNFVLLDATSAASAWKQRPSDTWVNNAIVVFGDYNTGYPEFYNGVPQEQIRRIKSVTYHPSFRYSTSNTFVEIIADSQANNEYHQEYALCLLELAEPVDYNDWIRPICLPPVEQKCNEFKDCRITGWGLDETFQTNNILKVAHVDEFTKGGCEAIEFYGSGRSVVLPEGTKCAISKQASIAFIGDFGGPLACDDVSNSYRTTLSGILTFNLGKNETNYSLISDVNSVTSDWIWTTCRSKLG